MGTQRSWPAFVPAAVWQRDPQLPALQELVKRSPVLDVGAGGRRLSPSVVTVDAEPHPGTNVLADIGRLPFRTASVAGLVCTGTLEHVLDPPQAVAEFARVLGNGGEIHVEVPFMQPYHADPHDYWRFTDEGLRVLFRGWEVTALGSHMGSGAGAAWVLREALKAPFRNRLVRAAIHVLIGYLVQPLRFVDRMSGTAGASASGFYLRARKRPFGSEGSEGHPAERAAG